MMECKGMYCCMLAVVAFVAVSQVGAKETMVAMDRGDHCGNVFVLGPGHDVRMTSSGRVREGYCGVTVYAQPKVDNYTCDAICVTFKTASIATCQVKLKFIGHLFRKDGDIVREFNCHQKDKAAFCWNVNSMRVEVVEEYNYAYNNQQKLYEFNIDAAARCSKDAVARKRYHATKEELAAQEHKTYVEGIAVGVSLACVFLIILFIMWCYSKHQAVVSSPSDTPTPTNRKKGSIVSTFRSKLHIKKKSESPEDPPATYRKTDDKRPDDIEATSELSPLTDGKEEGAETFILASETPKADQAGDSNGGQDSPKDGGDEVAKLSTPEVVVLPGTPEPQDGNESGSGKD